MCLFTLKEDYFENLEETTVWFSSLLRSQSDRKSVAKGVQDQKNPRYYKHICGSLNSI